MAYQKNITPAHVISVAYWNHNTRYLETDDPDCDMGKVQLYRFRGDHPAGKPWHLVCFGRFFISVTDAVTYFQTVVDHWNNPPDLEQQAMERAAETRYQAQYAYACGYHD